MQEIPYGYCHCGCGKQTKCPTYSQPRRGYVKGQPNKYLHGHGPGVAKSSAKTFWARVRVGGPAECWLWQGSVLKQLPYGQLMFNRKMWTAHRLAWFFTHGDIPDGLFVLHRCDNPRCCNPSHLFLGTALDNMTDMKLKGRGRNRRTGKWPRDEFGVIQKMEPTPA